MGRLQRLNWRILAVALGSLLVLASAAPARPAANTTTARTCSYTKSANVPARMRDGTILYADVYRPKLEGTVPVVLMRLPYDKSVAQTYVYASPAFYAEHCYLVVIQDVRGQYTSQGFFYTFRNEARDG